MLSSKFKRGEVFCLITSFDKATDIDGEENYIFGVARLVRWIFFSTFNSTPQCVKNIGPFNIYFKMFSTIFPIYKNIQN